MTHTDNALAKARTHIATVWSAYMSDRNLKAQVPDWQTLTAGDGTPLLSVQAVGPGAAHALSRFITTGPIGLPVPGDTRPTIDYSVPGRIAYVWRSHGVWIELWVSDAQAMAPQPVRSTSTSRQAVVGEPVLSAPVPSQAARPAPSRRGLGARLPFARKRRTTDKETTNR